MELYGFVLSLVPFIFEKVRSIEAAYLMLSEDEIKLLLASELPCILEIVDDEEDEELMSALEALLLRALELNGLPNNTDDVEMKGRLATLRKNVSVLKSFEERTFGPEKYTMKREARKLADIGPLHFMLLKLEETEQFEERINLVRNIESMIRLPRPLIQLFLARMDAHMLVSRILLGEAASHTERTHMLKYYTEELEIACFDFLGELLKANLRCLTLFESQMGLANLTRLFEKGLAQPVNSNLFFRSLLISMLYLSKQHPTLRDESFLMRQTIATADLIFMGLLDSIRNKPIDSNNKSIVITCLMIYRSLK
jgi:hypothetical protein